MYPKSPIKDWIEDEFFCFISKNYVAGQEEMGYQKCWQFFQVLLASFFFGLTYVNELWLVYGKVWRREWISFVSIQKY